MMMSGKDFLTSHVLSWRRKVYSDWEDVTSFDWAFQVFGPAVGNHPGNAPLQTVDCLTCGTRRRLVLVDCRDHLPGRLRTDTSGPRYGSALPWRTLKAVLYSIRSGTCNQWRVVSASVSIRGIRVRNRDRRSEPNTVVHLYATQY